MSRLGRSASFQNSPSSVHLPSSLSRCPYFLPFILHIQQRDTARGSPSCLFTSPVVNLELPQSSTAATHYVRVARSIHASPRIVQDAPVIFGTTLGSRRNLPNVSLVTLHASMHMENSVSPFLSPPRLAGIRKLLFSRTVEMSAIDKDGKLSPRGK